jgi:hypothetical protein
VYVDEAMSVYGPDSVYVDEAMSVYGPDSVYVDEAHAAAEQLAESSG